MTLRVASSAGAPRPARKVEIDDEVGEGRDRSRAAGSLGHPTQPVEELRRDAAERDQTRSVRERPEEPGIGDDRPALPTEGERRPVAPALLAEEPTFDREELRLGGVPQRRGRPQPVEGLGQEGPTELAGRGPGEGRLAGRRGSLDGNDPSRPPHPRPPPEGTPRSPKAMPPPRGAGF